MILIDDRVGSRELEGLFKGSGIPTRLERLSAGDFAFRGNWKGERVWVGVERKTVGDMMNSIRTHRFVEQLPKMCKKYAKPFLLLEGEYRAGRKGVLEVQLTDNPLRSFWKPLQLGKSNFMYAELENALTTYTLMSPIRLLRTRSREETAYRISMLYRYFQKEEHTACEGLYQSDTPLTLLPPTLVRRFAAELPGIGWGKSKAVAERFRSPRAMCKAKRADWEEIDGIGETLARRIDMALDGKRVK